MKWKLNLNKARYYSPQSKNKNGTNWEKENKKHKNEYSNEIKTKLKQRKALFNTKQKNGTNQEKENKENLERIWKG